MSPLDTIEKNVEEVLEFVARPYLSDTRVFQHKLIQDMAECKKLRDQFASALKAITPRPTPDNQAELEYIWEWLDASDSTGPLSQRHKATLHAALTSKPVDLEALKKECLGIKYENRFGIEPPLHEKEAIEWVIDHLAYAGHITTDTDELRRTKEAVRELVGSIREALEIAEMSVEDPDTVLIEHLKEALTKHAGVLKSSAKCSIKKDGA